MPRLHGLAAAQAVAVRAGCVASSLQVKLSVVGRQIELLYPIHFQEVKRGAVKQQKGDPTPGVTPRGGSKVRANDVVRCA